MRTVIILAAGESRRFNIGIWPPQPKQLLLVEGEPLIARTIRMVVERGHTPTVVTHHLNVRDVSTMAGARVFKPEAHRWLLETLWSARHLWRGMVTVLYSDVIYSPAVLDALLAEQRSPMFHGRWGDMFGWAFHANDARHAEAIQAVLASADQQPEGEFDAARSWQLYRALQGWDLYQHIGPTEDNAFYTLVPDTDYTRDIDKPGDWEAAQRDVLATGKLREGNTV